MTPTATSALPDALPTVPPSRQVSGFVLVGALTTAAYAALFALAAPVVGAQVANALALLLTADVNTRANRRYSFGVPAAQATARQRLQGSLAFALTWSATSVALAVLARTGSTSSSTQTVVLVLANALSGVAHFVLLERWAFRA